MRIKNHKLVGASFTPARLTGGTITPEIVILHDTAGRLDKGNSAQYLATTTKASVHFVVERDGSIAQLVPTNRRAGHAGQSSYHGRNDCNAFSIGIEIVNPGRMTDGGAGRARAWWGEYFPLSDGVVERTTPEHGHGFWMDYTPEQIDAVTALLAALFDGIKSLKDITTHWYVSPGRKVDVNPLFPLDHIRARVLGRDDPAVMAAEAESAPVDQGEHVQINTPGSALNMRRWPSFNPNVITAIPTETVVPVLREGVFGGRKWLCVLFAGQEGWIVATYADPVLHSAPVSQP